MKTLPKLIRFTPNAEGLFAYSKGGKLFLWDVDSGKLLFEKTMKRPLGARYHENKLSVKFHDESIEEHLLGHKVDISVSK